MRKRAKRATLEDALKEIIHLHRLVAALRAHCSGCPHRERARIGFDLDVRGGSLGSESYEQDRGTDEFGDEPEERAK